MNQEGKKIFARTYNEYRRAIMNYFYYRVSNHFLAEDLTQKTFLNTWSYLISGNKVDNIKSFLYKVAHNLLVDHYRQKEKQPISADMEKYENMPDARHKNMEKDIINKVLLDRHLKTLKRRQRRIIRMRYVKKMNISQISEYFGYSRNNTSVIIHRAGKTLKDKFKKGSCL